MSLEAVAIAGTITFGISFLLGVIWYWGLTKSRRKTTVNGKVWVFKYSRQILSAILASLAVLTYMHVVQILEQGFMLRGDGITFWWPRYVAYALAFAAQTYAMAVFLWMRTKDKAMMVINAVAFWVVAGLIAAFSETPDNWVHFGVGFIPLSGLFYRAWAWKKRNDNIAYFFLSGYTLFTLLYAVVWALSPPGADIIDIELAWWVYFGLDIFTAIVGAVFIMRMYISIKDAQEKPVQRESVTTLSATSYVSHVPVTQTYFGGAPVGDVDMTVLGGVPGY